jgi:hypothetical protein
MNPKKRQRLTIQYDGATAVVALDHIEIWDGADLALLREVLSELISQDGFRSIGVDLASVKYIPSGFFGMLFEWYDSGVDIQLHSPQPNVEQMLWFRMFFSPRPEGHFQLSDEAVRDHTPNQQMEYHKREFMEGQNDDAPEENVGPVRYGMSTTGRQDST